MLSTIPALKEALDNTYSIALAALEEAIMAEVVRPFCDKYHLIHLGGGDFGNGQSLDDFFICGMTYIKADWGGRKMWGLSNPVIEWLTLRGHVIEQFKDDLSAVYVVIHDSWSRHVRDVVTDTLNEEYDGTQSGEE